MAVGESGGAGDPEGGAGLAKRRQHADPLLPGPGGGGQKAASGTCSSRPTVLIGGARRHLRHGDLRRGCAEPGYRPGLCHLPAVFKGAHQKSRTSRLLTASLLRPGRTPLCGRSRMLVEAYSNFIAGPILAVLYPPPSPSVLFFAGDSLGLIGLITFAALSSRSLGPMFQGFWALLIFTSDPKQVGWFLLAFFLVRRWVTSIVYPRIMAGAIAIPSIWVLVAVTLGAWHVLALRASCLFIPLVAVVYHFAGGVC